MINNPNNLKKLKTWTDTHCHVNYMEDQDLVLKRAYDADVRRIICISTKPEETDRIKQVVSLAKENGVDAYRSVGIHPLYCTDFTIDAINNYLYTSSLEDVVAVGETGLDDYRSELDKRQIESFEKHIEFGIEKNLPIVMHSRSGSESKVEEMTKSILRRYKEASGIAHCFNGSPELAEFLLEIGWYISFSAVITYKNTEVLKQIAKKTPMDRILIETDSPFLPPQSLRGKKNEPANVVYVGRQIADIKGISEEECMLMTSQNAAKVFNFEVY